MKKNEHTFDKATNSYPTVSYGTWRFLPDTISLLANSRTSMEQEKSPVQGVNYSIILLSACYLEGALTSALWQLHNFSAYRRSMTTADFLQREKTILRADGLDKFNETCELVLGKKLSTLVPDSHWEEIKMLFQIRNILAHGKEIFHYLSPLVTSESGKGVTLPSTVDYFWGDNETGKKIEDFLVKRKQIEKKAKPDPRDFFTTKVADYFSSIPKTFLMSVYNNLDDASQGVFAFATSIVSLPQTSKEEFEKRFKKA